MKKKTHPEYQQVLFVDSATGTKFVCGSTLQPKETENYKGIEYPMQRVSVSSASHPFFTGSKTLVDAEGRVDKFKKRYGAHVRTPQAESEETQMAAPQEIVKEKAPAVKASPAKAPAAKAKAPAAKAAPAAKPAAKKK